MYNTREGESCKVGNNFFLIHHFLHRKMGRRHIQYDPQWGYEFKAQDRKGKAGGGRQRNVSQHLQRCHVIEGVVQLLTNGFVLQLLSVQFVWRPEVDRKYRQVVRDSGDTNKPKAGEGWEAEEEQREEGEDKKIGSALKKKIQKCWMKEWWIYNDARGSRATGAFKTCSVGLIKLLH